MEPVAKNATPTPPGGNRTETNALQTELQKSLPCSSNGWVKGNQRPKGKRSLYYTPQLTTSPTAYVRTLIKHLRCRHGNVSSVACQQHEVCREKSPQRGTFGEII